MLFSSRKKKKTLLGKRRQQKRIFLTYVGCFLFIALLVGFIFLMRVERLQIVDVVILGGDNISHNEIHSFVDEVLDESYVFVIPKSNMFVYPKRYLENGILERFSRVQNISMSHSFSQTLSVEFGEYEPYALWCEGVSPHALDFIQEETESDTTCFYLSEAGYIYAQAPDFSEGVYFRFHNETDREYPVKTFYEKDNFSELRLLIDRIGERGFESLSLTKLGDGSFVLGLSGGGRIVFDSEIGFDVTFDNLASILRDPETGLTPVLETQDKIDYIDLRYDRKVYFKLHEQAEE